MQRNGFGIEVIVDGAPLREYVHNGKVYVAAPWNKDYQLRFIVPGYGRFEVVASVDGNDGALAFRPE
jgi:hypothetical protein